MIEFFAAGIPRPAGSKKAFFRPGMRHPAITEDCEKSAPWREDIRNALQQAYRGPPMSGPIRIMIEFRLARLKSHFRTGRRAAELRDDAPDWSEKGYDVDKLQRALFDALKGLAWNDDKQVADVHATKRYCDRPGAMVQIARIDEGPMETAWRFKYEPPIVLGHMHDPGPEPTGAAVTTMAARNPRKLRSVQ